MTVVLGQTFRPGGDQLLEAADPLQNAVQSREDVLALHQTAQLRLLGRALCTAGAFAAVASGGHVVVDAQPMVQRGERTADVTRRETGGGQRGRLATATTSSPVTVKAARPPVDGSVDDGGQHGGFLREGGGEGARFVAMRDLEEQALVGAAVDLVPQVLRLENAAETEDTKKVSLALAC